MTHKVGHQCRQLIESALRPAVFDRDILPFDIAGFGEALTERGQAARGLGGG